MANGLYVYSLWNPRGQGRLFPYKLTWQLAGEQDLKLDEVTMRKDIEENSFEKLGSDEQTAIGLLRSSINLYESSIQRSSNYIELAYASLLDPTT